LPFRRAERRISSPDFPILASEPIAWVVKPLVTSGQRLSYVFEERCTLFVLSGEGIFKGTARLCLFQQLNTKDLSREPLITHWRSDQPAGPGRGWEEGMPYGAIAFLFFLSKMMSREQ
jgi:hypothetical protein